MRERRLQVWEALERHPDVVFSPLGGAVAHAVKERQGPTLLCTSECGFTGYAPSLAFELPADTAACMRCTRALGAGSEPPA